MPTFSQPHAAGPAGKLARRFPFVVCAALLALPLSAEPNPADLKASFSQEKVVVRSSGALSLDLKVQNTASEDAAIKPPFAAAESLRVETSDGKALTPAPAKPAEGAAALGSNLPDKLPAGQEAAIEVDLRARFPDLSKPGTYRVTWKHPSIGADAKTEVRVVEGYAAIKTNFGEIVIEFHPEDAPNTVDNFITLAKKNFYKDLLFHRIIPGFMMQGGCPNGNGSGGPGYTIKAEFNARKHLPGTVSMARKATGPDTAGSQFFICFAPRESLDGQYTAFAEVVKGMDVAKKVEAVGSPSGRPTQKVQIEKVTVSDTPPKADPGK